VKPKPSGQKWIAEDTFVTSILEMIWARDPGWCGLLRLARGKRIYAIWSFKDPLPAIAYLATHFIPSVLGRAMRALKTSVHQKQAGPACPQEEDSI
jgi:hypothetical protein